MSSPAIVAVVYDTHSFLPVPGIVIQAFIMEYPCGHWVTQTASPPDKFIPAPPSGDFGQPLAEIARTYSIQPGGEHRCT